MSEQHTFFRISPALQGICEEVTASLREIFSQIEETTEYNQQKDAAREEELLPQLRNAKRVGKSL